MSKDCGKHEGDKFARGLLFCIFFFIVIVLLVILIVYLVLRPTKPRFYLQDATVIQFNLTQPNLLSSQIQVTVSSLNPNDRIGVFYDKLDIYASYKSQQITLAAQIPPLYQGHKDVDVWSPYLSGLGIPIAPFLAEALQQDQSDGYFFLFVKIDGRIRWKVGSWTSGTYRLLVNCPAYLSFDRRAVGAGDGGGGFAATAAEIKFQRISTCSVDV